MKDPIPHRIVILTIFLCSFAFANDHISSTTVSWKNDTSQAFLINNSPRTFKLKTSALLRDNLPWNKEKVFSTSNDYPQIESNSIMFDSLYALSVIELKENSVEQITDHSFSSSDCHCFETGRKWNYVWTRDISYSAHLALASFNQQRTLNSLLFKVSKRRGHGVDSLEIVQDTGTGGSWPVSTDRVVWSIAANELIKHLDGKQRSTFIKTAYTALKNTVTNDRLAVYDQTDGLYTGEQSFLDWREQTYPQWVSTNVVHIGMSKALSTNITHFMALKTTAELALELGYVDEFKYYYEQASNLKSSINRYFWDEEKGLYSTFLLTYLDQTKIDKYDLLGNSMAILFDIAVTQRQKNALENYPMVMAGAPVIAPQDPQAPIYHNRAIWPFVTQYGLLAAKKNKQTKIYNHLFDSMIRATALNLSNMENYEFLSMNNWLDDGILTGPVVNSQRQLWSVAGMLSTYIDGVFGKKVEGNKIAFQPFITDKIRNTILKDSNELSLKSFKYRNKLIDIQIQLPVRKSNWNDFAYYEVESIKLNSKFIKTDEFIKHSDLLHKNNISIILGELKYSNERPSITNLNAPHKLSQTDYERLFSPRTPTLHSITDKDGEPELHFGTNNFESVAFNIYRNGKLIANNIFASSYTDKTSSQITTPCYTVETVFKSSKNRSMHSEPHCYWRANAITQIPVTHPNIRSQGPLNFFSEHGRIFLKKWGSSSDKLEFSNHKVNEDGTYALQLTYNNLGHINTGITAAVKKVSVINDVTRKIIATKVFMMPHHNREKYWIDSNFVQVELKANTSYSFELSDFYNMSYFEHFSTYLYRGGRSGAYNFANITELKILRIK